jgi:hypothetical protein
MSRIQQRRTEVNSLLSTAYSMSQTELQKPFPEINLNGAISTYNKIVQQFGDFPEQVARAKELLTSVQEKYLQSKIAYLETRAQLLDQMYAKNEDDQTTPKKPDDTTPPALPPMESILSNNEASVTVRSSTQKTSQWNGIEQNLFVEWLQANPEGTLEHFYEEQSAQAVTLKGIIEHYNRNIKNKPGDFLLVNPTTHLPTAYLYSTRVNLQDLVGHEITLQVVPRPNNNFAFPAYFVLSHD